MKLECVNDVIMNVSREKVFTKGKIYNGYYYSGRNSHLPGKKVFCAKNDLGERHIIQNPANAELDEFFTGHFKKVED